MPVYPFWGRVPPTKIDYRKKGTRIRTSPLEHLGGGLGFARPPIWHHGQLPGHADAVQVLESMRHDNSAPDISVDFRLGLGLRGFFGAWGIHGWEATSPT